MTPVIEYKNKHLDKKVPLQALVTNYNTFKEIISNYASPTKSSTVS